MVIKRKVTKKKTTKKTVSRASTATAPGGVPKKKGVAPKQGSAASSVTIALGDSIVISDVLEWHKKMLKAISGKEEIILDGSEIEHIDGTGLQLLVALMKEATTNKQTVSWKAASDVLCSNAAQLGLAEILGLDNLSGQNR